MAKPVEFPQQNIVFGENQPEYLPLPAFKAETQSGEVVTCWELTDEEMEALIRTRRIYLTQLTFHSPLQPVRIDGFCPLSEEVNAVFQ